MTNKDKYLDRAHALFLEEGVAGITMDEIAEKIGVTKMTLYNNFKDKKELVSEVLSFRTRKYLSYILEEEAAISHHVKVKKSEPATAAHGEVNLAGKMNAIETMIKVLEFQSRNPFPSSKLFYSTFKKAYPELYKKHINGFLEGISRFIRANISQGIAEGLYRSDIDGATISQYITDTMDNMLRTLTSDTDRTLDLNRVHLQVIDYHIRGISNENGLKVLEVALRKLKNSTNDKISKEDSE